MKAMRNLLVTILVALSAVLAVSYSACNKNKCHNVTCLNHGVCDGGNCVCPVGFEGNRCQTLMRDKFIANYNGFDSCGFDSFADTVTVYPVKLLAVLRDSVEMVLHNLMGEPADSAICTIQSTDSFTFIGSNNSTTYSGWGKMRNDSLWLRYHVQQDTTSFDCKFFGQSLR